MEQPPLGTVRLICSVSCTHSTISCPILYIVARVAYDQLKTEDPQALKKAEDLLRKYSDKFTQEHEKDYPFVECVTLPDDNKRAGGGW